MFLCQRLKTVGLFWGQVYNCIYWVDSLNFCPVWIEKHDSHSTTIEKQFKCCVFQWWRWREWCVYVCERGHWVRCHRPLSPFKGGSGSLVHFVGGNSGLFPVEGAYHSGFSPILGHSFYEQNFSVHFGAPYFTAFFLDDVGLPVGPSIQGLQLSLKPSVKGGLEADAGHAGGIIWPGKAPVSSWRAKEGSWEDGGSSWPNPR